MKIQKVINYKIKQLSETKTDLTNAELLVNVSEDKANGLIHRALVKQQKEKRQGTSSTKTRAEVRGGGKKPWSQKGRGRARAGSANSPLWKGGGVSFGPKPKTYTSKLNKKEWKLSLQTLLYNKKENTILLDSFAELTRSYKTKDLLSNLNKIVSNTNEKISLIVPEKELNMSNLVLASKNLSNITVLPANALNIERLVMSNVIVMSQQTLTRIKEVYCG
jgi:large subunit ribosomal protein L4